MDSGTFFSRGFLCQSWGDTAELTAEHPRATELELELDNADAGEDLTRLMHVTETLNQRCGTGTALTASTGL